MKALEILDTFLDRPERDLVFWVGAGVSAGGATGLPASSTLIHALLDAGLRLGGGHEDDVYQTVRLVLPSAATQLGFEETLDQLWLIYEPAIPRLFRLFRIMEESSRPNSAHAALAYWLGLHGTVITTNYDRLIERSASSQVRTCFSDIAAEGFASWRDDLARGGVLFKLHGSLEEEGTCLGALEQVGTVCIN